METDYLIVGAGAQGRIFADELLAHTDAHITLVDRRDHVGGHWNDAYSFVRLHQPSVYYGMGSQPLGRDRIETDGVNAGLFEQATGHEVLEHFQNGMQDRLLSSGRVTFLSGHEYGGDWVGEHVVRSLSADKEQRIKTKNALVDTTWFNVQTPETHTPRFSIDEDAPLTTPARLPLDLPGHEKVVVIGGGKTSMDVVIWLTENGIAPDDICWIRPRDSWLLNREAAQPGDAGYLRMVRSQLNRMEASAQATTVEELYLLMEQRGEFLRIDPNEVPTMNHGATISRGEIDVLARVRDVVRHQRVQAVSRGCLTFDKGDRHFPENTLFVDCTAKAFHYRPPEPVFKDKTITLQIIRDGLISFSVAAIAYIEANYTDEQRKNALAVPVPYEEDPASLIKRYKVDMTVQGVWAKEKA